tara:strand:- start:873 stop:1046 length:174 start_codon:yes stop_codon:yes gene_type:complete
MLQVSRANEIDTPPQAGLRFGFDQLMAAGLRHKIVLTCLLNLLTRIGAALEITPIQT